MSQSTPPQPRPPKAMSSRLMTMKFMQRAAAFDLHQSQSQPSNTPPKRQKLSKVTPSTIAIPSDSDHIQSALDEAELKRERAIERLAEEAGETKWVLSTVNGDTEEDVEGLQVAMAGFSDIDQDSLRPAMQGRQSFGKFNGQLEKRQNGKVNESSSSSDDASSASDEDDEESDDPAGPDGLVYVAKEKAERLERKQQRKASKAEMARLAEKRRSKGVNLNRLSSISGGGGSAGKPGGKKDSRECYRCGEEGHERGDCPQKEQRGNQGGGSSHSK